MDLSGLKMELDLSAIEMELNNIIQSMFNQGIMDYQFAQIQALQDDENPNFVTEIITSYSETAKTIILELDKILGQQDVDFNGIDQYIHQLKGSSASIGAKGMQLACTNIQKSTNVRNKEGCLKAFDKMVHEYCTLHGKFQTVVQVEKAIFDIKTKQQSKEPKNSVEST